MVQRAREALMSNEHPQKKDPWSFSRLLGLAAVTLTTVFTIIYVISS